MDSYLRDTFEKSKNLKEHQIAYIENFDTWRLAEKLLLRNEIQFNYAERLLKKFEYLESQLSIKKNKGLLPIAPANLSVWKEWLKAMTTTEDKATPPQWHPIAGMSWNWEKQASPFMDEYLLKCGRTLLKESKQTESWNQDQYDLLNYVIVRYPSFVNRKNEHHVVAIENLLKRNFFNDEQKLELQKAITTSIFLKSKKVQAQKKSKYENVTMSEEQVMNIVLDTYERPKKDSWDAHDIYQMRLAIKLLGAETVVDSGLYFKKQYPNDLQTEMFKKFEKIFNEIKIKRSLERATQHQPPKIRF